MLAERSGPTAPAVAVVSSPAESGRPAARVRLGLTALALAAWVAVVATSRWWGLALLRRHPDLTLPEPPLLGRPGPGWTPRLLIPVVIGALLVAVAPIAARRLRWRVLLVATAVGAAAWAVSLALVEGPAGLTRGLAGHTELGTDVPRVAAGPLRFLSTFTDRLATFNVQARGHPPGMLLLLTGLQRIGLGGNGWAAVLCIVAGCAGAAAAIVATREVAGEAAARRAAPFVAIAPAAVWIATSADAFYLGIASVTVSALVVALHRAGRVSDRWALAAGVGFGACLMLSYGLVLIAVVPIAVAWRVGRVRPLIVALAAAGVVLGGFALLGFWWPLGLLATREQYRRLHVWRPWWYFVFADLGAWALALGPALAVALTRLRDRALWVLVGGGLAAAAVADLSGLSEGEVERIWLPFTMWVLLAGAALWPRDRDGSRSAAVRGWLLVQAASAVGLVALVRTQW
jgi:methylthioxylose transferase